MATDRRRHILLAVIMVILGVVGFRAWKETSVPPSQTSNLKSTAAARDAAPGRQGSARLETPDVRLEALGEDRPKPGASERNLFRFKPKAPPPDTRPAARPPVNTAPPPAGPPPLPPINLKFIGLIDRGAGQPRIAVLTDGIGPPMQGVEGGTVAGKYKILRIGAESIEIAYLDGRGRQTIRLSGS